MVHKSIMGYSCANVSFQLSIGTWNMVLILFWFGRFYDGLVCIFSDENKSHLSTLTPSEYTLFNSFIGLLNCIQFYAKHVRYQNETACMIAVLTLL